MAAPLIVDSSFIFPYVATKAFYARALIQLTLLLWLPAAIMDPRVRTPVSAALVAVLAFFVAHATATASGVDAVQSFWGTVEREDGLVTLAHLTAFFAVVAGLMRSSRDRALIVAINALVTVAVVVLLLGDPRLGSVTGAGFHRPSATLGNPVHAAEYLLVSTFLCSWLAGTSASKAGRALGAAAAAAAATGVIVTATRGAILGLILGLMVGGLVMMVRSGRRPGRAGAAVLVGLILLAAGALAVIRSSTWIEDVPILQRAGGSKAASKTLTSRRLIWSAAIDAVSERPLVGYGRENVAVAIDRHYPSELLRITPRQPWVDRVHSAPLDQLLAGGLVALAAWIALYWAGFKSLSRLRGDSRGGPVAEAALYGGLTAHAVANLVSFDTPTTRLVFLLLLALVAACTQPSPQHPQLPMAPTTSRHLGVRAALAAGVAAILIAPLCVATVVRPAQANLTGAQAVFALQRGDRAGATQALRRALDMDTYQSGEIVRLWTQSLLEADLPSSRRSNKTVPEPLIRLTRTALETQIARHPTDLKARFLLLSLANASQDRAFLATAPALAAEAIEVAPRFTLTYLVLAESLTTLGRTDEAVETLRTATALDPRNPRPRQAMITLLEALGRFEEAGQERALLDDAERPARALNAPVSP